MKLLATVKEHDSFIYALMILAEAEEEGISDLDIQEAAHNHEGRRTSTAVYNTLIS